MALKSVRSVWWRLKVPEDWRLEPLRGGYIFHPESHPNSRLEVTCIKKAGEGVTVADFENYFKEDAAKHQCKLLDEGLRIYLKIPARGGNWKKTSWGIGSGSHLLLANYFQDSDNEAPLIEFIDETLRNVEFLGLLTLREITKDPSSECLNFLRQTEALRFGEKWESVRQLLAASGFQPGEMILFGCDHAGGPDMALQLALPDGSIVDTIMREDNAGNYTSIVEWNSFTSPLDEDMHLAARILTNQELAVAFSKAVESYHLFYRAVAGSSGL